MIPVQEVSNRIAAVIDDQLRIVNHAFPVSILLWKAPHAQITIRNDIENSILVGKERYSLEPITNFFDVQSQPCYVFYCVCHDNIVAEFLLLEPYQRSKLHKRLMLLRKKPADQGGVSLFGICDFTMTALVTITADPSESVTIHAFGVADIIDKLQNTQRSGI